jgi:ribosomal protein S27E
MIFAATYDPDYKGWATVQNNRITDCCPEDVKYWAEMIETPMSETRDHEVVRERAAFGRSTMDIKCPFCGEVTTCYKWSLAGSGKKCACGAKHTLYRGTVRETKW